MYVQRVEICRKVNLYMMQMQTYPPEVSDFRANPCGYNINIIPFEPDLPLVASEMKCNN